MRFLYKVLMFFRLAAVGAAVLQVVTGDAQIGSVAVLLTALATAVETVFKSQSS